jgi:sigma-B regulation protein RsbU (phosphoserine phosphatase)
VEHARSTDEADVWDDAVTDLLDRAKMVQPDELAWQVNAAAREVAEITIYLIDHEQVRLWALPERGKPTPPPVDVEGTAAGRAFTQVSTQPPDADGDDSRWWVPLIDGAERLGVAMVIPRRPAAIDAETFTEYAQRLIGLVGHLVSVKFPYGDALHQVRRTRPMTPASELLMPLLPPLTFSCPRLVVSAILEPCYDVGGDAFDYAVDGSLARFTVLDGMGRGMSAGLTSAAAIAAVRATRRAGDDLVAMAAAADDVLCEQFPDLRYVTAVLAELDLETGKLRYVNAGHPPPMLIRDGRVTGTLTGGRRMPLGLPEPVEGGTADLEPGDRLLLYTDGVTEAYAPNGERFGAERLVDLTERCTGEKLPAPETLRRLSHQVLAHQAGRPADDATLMLVEWSEAAAERTQP